MTAVTVVQAAAEAPPPAGLRDPRLGAWRELFAARAAAVLREYQAAWAEPGLDDTARTTATVGRPSPPAPTHLPALPSDGLLARIVDLTGIGLGAEAVLAGAWWPTVDAQLAVLFGCVHDDPTRRHATLGALAVLLGPVGVDVPLAVPPGHPLVAGGLCEPVPDADAPLRLPAATAALLAGQRPEPPQPDRLAPRIAAAAEKAAALIELGARVLVRCELADDREPVRDAVASRLGLPVAPPDRTATSASLLFRLGHDLPAVVVADGQDVPTECVLAVSGAETVAGTGRHTLDLGAPELKDARRTWRRALRTSGLHPPPAEIADLAGRLPLTERTIAAIVHRAALAARAAGRTPNAADVRATLRTHPRHELGGLARRLPPGVRLADLVLPVVTRDGLAEVIAHARHAGAVQARLGLPGSRGRAVVALFHGPSGTGKTAAAEAVAAEIDRDLWIVDLARVVSKWLGETQRNLDAVLREAAAARAVLLFDEADGLFGKRGEVTDARDRYANLEIDHLLQRIELHTGIVVLTSNRPAAIDEAFARRIRLAVRFDLPDHAQREEIWRRMLPADLLADGVSTDIAAREELSGAAIRSAAVAAAVAAADAGAPIRAEQLDAAVVRELEKLKRAPTVPARQR